MRLAHKIKKAFNGAALKSSGDALHRLTHPIRVEEVLKQVDPEGLERIRKKYHVPGELTHWPKYVDAPRWTRLSIRRAQDLRLNTRKEPIRIFDLGSGGGYFLLVSQALGHSGLGLDTDQTPMYQEMFDTFGLKRITHWIKAFEPLPDVNERFDLVTAFSVCFNAHNTDQLWTPKEWDFFLSDLKARFLKPTGEIFLGMNPERDGSFYTPELKKFFIQRGAEVDRSKVWFKNLSRIP